MYEPRTKTSSDLVEILGLGALLVLLLLLTYSAISVNSSLPIVKKSNSTQKCVEVISEDNSFSCKNMPDKYSLVWVK